MKTKIKDRRRSYWSCLMLFAIGTLWLNDSLGQNVFINEIHYDNSGTDAGEAIEIAGTAGTDLTGWSLVLYNGNGGTSYNTVGLSSALTDQGEGFGFYTVNYPVNGIQNGSPDGVVLVDASNNVVQFLSYEGSFTATNGPALGLTSEDISVSESGTTTVGYSLQLIGRGEKYTDFSWSALIENTFGAVNTGQHFDGVTNGSLKYIHEIQGDGLASLLVGQTVSIEGIVVGDFQASEEGFFVQEEDADADANPNTSEGVFVYAPGALDVQVGDKVKVSGTVTEYFDLTEINNVTNLEVVGTGFALPGVTSINLPVVNSTYLESFEGMYVTFPQKLTVTDTYYLGRGGEVLLSYGDRLYQPTQVATPGTAANNKLAENNLNKIVLDEGSTNQNPDPVIFPSPKLTFNDEIRGGFTTTGIKGVLTYAWSGFNSSTTTAYRVYATEAPVFVDENPRTTNPESVGGTLKVASFNVLNYFNGDGLGGGFPTSRGANNLAEFNKQRTKIINAIVALDADIVGIMEIENDGYVAKSAIWDLVNGLNNAGSVTYTFVNPGVTQIGTDEIAVGFIYNTATVVPVGSAAILDSNVDPLFNTNKNRPALAQTFKELLSGIELTVCVNHFKSKGSDCNDLGDPDTNDGQGNCNVTRTNAANALANWLNTNPTGSASNYRIILGDLNSYAKEDPIVALENSGYTNLLVYKKSNLAHSYSFGGQWGTLDYVLANPSLLSKISGATSWNINADEPIIFDYNEEFKSAGQVMDYYSSEPYRASDHDPLIVGIDFNPVPAHLMPIWGAIENKEETSLAQLFVQPNPAENFMEIRGNDFTGKVVVEVFDLMGKKIIENHVNVENNLAYKLNMSDWVKGVYILRINSEGKIFQQKIEKY